MNDALSPQENLLQHIQQRLIPWAGDEALRFVLMQPPFHGLDADRVTPLSAPLLRPKTKSQAVISRWPEAALNAVPYPCLCCVVDGQVEWRVGVTRRMQQTDPQLDKRFGRYDLRLPVRSFLLMPPDIPFSDGTQPHWYSDENVADSVLFWLHCTPQGADLHLCSTRDGVHRSYLPIYMRDAHLLTMAELLLEDVRAAAPKPATTTRHYLLLMLLRIERMLLSKKVLATSATSALVPHQAEESEGEEPFSTTTEVLLVQRAQRFIQAHLTTTLSVQRIADHLYISPSHLSRIFARELGVSPMHYVNATRMELARSLLVETRYPIQYISDFFGYSSPDVFSRAFKQHFNAAPHHYRRNTQGSAARSSNAVKNRHKLSGASRNHRL
jgi:AraC-like DNA-binding protein